MAKDKKKMLEEQTKILKKMAGESKMDCVTRCGEKDDWNYSDKFDKCEEKCIKSAEKWFKDMVSDYKKRFFI